MDTIITINEHASLGTDDVHAETDIDLVAHRGLLNCSRDDLARFYSRQQTYNYRSPSDVYKTRMDYITRCFNIQVTSSKSYTEISYYRNSVNKSNTRLDNQYWSTAINNISVGYEIKYWAEHEFNVHRMIHTILGNERERGLPETINSDLRLPMYETCGVDGCEAASVGPCPLHLSHQH